MDGVVVPIDFYLEQLEGSIMRNKQKFPKSNSSIDEYIGKSILIEEAPFDDENDSSVAFPSVSLVNGQTYNIETVLEVVQYANPIIDFRYKIENVNTRIDLSIYS